MGLELMHQFTLAQAIEHAMTLVTVDEGKEFAFVFLSHEPMIDGSAQYTPYIKEALEARGVETLSELTGPLSELGVRVGISWCTQEGIQERLAQLAKTYHVGYYRKVLFYGSDKLNFLPEGR